MKRFQITFLKGLRRFTINVAKFGQILSSKWKRIWSACTYLLCRDSTERKIISKKRKSYICYVHFCKKFYYNNNNQKTISNLKVGITAIDLATKMIFDYMATNSALQ